jgi:ketosteroid isomerase-like protein
VTAAPATPAPVAPVTTASTTAAAPTAPAPSTSNAGATTNAVKDVESVVRAWASAWSAKDVKTYLGLYGKEFDTPGNMSRTNWEEERRLRITSKSTISVKLENLTVSVNGSKATAKFRQDYKANGLAVSSRKVLELSKAGDHWRIVKESVGN